MTHRNARSAGLVAAAVVILLWSAWRIVDARLNTSTAIAAWGLWLVLAVALASAVAYLRELVQHRGSSRRVGWRPVPGVMLLWIAGLSTVGVFGFLMPDAGAASTSTQAPVADGSTPSAPSPTPSPTTATPTTASPTTAATPTQAASVSRSQPRAVPVAVRTWALAPRAASTTSAPRPATSPTPTASPTSTSLLGLPLLPNGGPHQTK